MNDRPPPYGESIYSPYPKVWSTDLDSFPTPSAEGRYSFTSATVLFRELKYQHYSAQSVASSEAHSNMSGSVISFHNLSYKVTTRQKGSICGKTEKILLDSISGMFKPGMNAIMGPTGCGKTTLLDILAGRKDQSGLSGLILVDGCKQPNNFNYMAGYVRQDDQIMGTLTVKENLMFSATLRLSSSVSGKDKKKKVEELIGDLGLTKCADTKVGTEFIRGVSGGERKRTCIGMELLVSRGILFLDEPTTGLDAFTANSVMSLLQRLSASGLTVIFSIHQPRYNIFRLFNTLMLLASGNIIFHGNASCALDFFQQQSFKCEEYNNPPDFFLDIINGDVSCHSSLNSSVYSSTSGCLPWETSQCTSQCTSQDIIFDGIVEPLGYSLEDLKKGSIIPALAKRFRESSFWESWNKRIDEMLRQCNDSSSSKNKNNLYEHSTSFLTQLFHVSKRTSKNILRNPAALIAQVCIMLIFGTVIGILYFNIAGKDTNAIQDRAGSFYLIIVVQMFGNLSAVELFIKERSLFLHECKSGFYRVSAYFISKIFCDLIPLRIIPLTIFSIITYFMMGLRRTPVNFFIYLLNLFLTTLCSAVMTFLFSASIRVFAIANTMVGLMILIMMLFGGLLLNVTSIPNWIRWVQYLSIVRYSFKTLLINELKDAEFHDISFPCLSNVTTGNQYLESQDVAYQTSWDLWKNMVALAVGTFILSALCYLRLRFLVRNK